MTSSQGEVRDRKVIEAIESAAKSGHIAETTRENLERTLRSIGSICGTVGFAYAIVRRPDNLLACMRERWSNVRTFRTRVSACVSALKWDATLGSDKTRAFWKKAFHDANAESHEAEQNNILTDREAASMPTFEDLEAAVDHAARVRKSSKLGSQQHLITLMAARVPPKRADYGKLRIVDNIDRVEANENYMVVPNDARRPVTLVLQTYKTSKAYGRYEESMPRSVGRAIRESLAVFPRTYLFENAKDTPFQSKQSWGKWIATAFQRHMPSSDAAKRVTTNGLRKLWVQTFADPNRFTLAQQAQLARAMLHHPHTQQAHYIHIQPSHARLPGDGPHWQRTH